jgi:hypothetical protein
VGEQLGRLAGPAIGGFMLAQFGLYSVVIADVLSFLASAGMIMLMSLPPALTRAAVAPGGGELTGSTAGATAASGSWVRLWRELKAGLHLMFTNRVLAALFVLWTITSTGEGLLDVLIVPWVSGVLAGTSLTFGWMMTAQAIGSLAGGALLASAGKTHQARGLVILGALGWGLVDVAIFNARSVPLGISSAVADRVGVVTMLNIACAVIVIGTAAGWVMLGGRLARWTGGTRVAG